MEKNYSQRLKEVLYLLASPHNVQINAFPEFVHIPDEIALETSNVIEFAPHETNNKDSDILKTLQEIAEIFDGMTGDANNWTLEGIKENPTWQHIRLLAQEEIGRQRLEYKVPDLFWVSYFQEKPLR